jgi:hypothetical protein
MSMKLNIQMDNYWKTKEANTEKEENEGKQ